MRNAVLFVALIGCDRGAEVQQLRHEVAALRVDVDALKRRAVNAPPSAAAPQAKPEVSATTVDFVQMVRADPVRISRASGLKLDDVVNEDGLVVDAEKIANAVRDKTIRMYGKTTAQRALVDAFGAEVGNAVFFGKIKNPK
jgi:hypothetical protein